MPRLLDLAKEVLERHPAPGLPLEELSHLVAREHADRKAPPSELAEALRRRPEEMRLLEGDPDRFGALGTTQWVVAPRERRNGGSAARSLAGRLRESVRLLGERVEPGSNLGLARWARLLGEESRVRRVLQGNPGPPAPHRESAPRTLRSTTRPR